MTTTSPNQLPDVHCTPLPDLWGPPATSKQGHMPKYFPDKRLSLSAASIPSSPTSYAQSPTASNSDRLSQLSLSFNGTPTVSSTSASTSPPTPTAATLASKPGPKMLSRSVTSSAIFPPSSKESIWWPSSAVPSSSPSASTTPTSSSVGQGPSTTNSPPGPPSDPQQPTPYMSFFNNSQAQQNMNMHASNQAPGSNSRSQSHTAYNGPRGVTLRTSALDDVLVSPSQSPMVTPIGYGGPVNNTAFPIFQPIPASASTSTLQFNRGLGIEHAHVLQQQQQQQVAQQMALQQQQQQQQYQHQQHAAAAHPMLQRHQSLPAHRTISPQSSHFAHYDIPPIDENWKRDHPMAAVHKLSISPSLRDEQTSSSSTVSSHTGTIASAASSTTSVASAGVKSVPLMSPVTTPTTPASSGQTNGSSSGQNSASSTPKRKNSAKNNINTELYKTELCSSFMVSGGNCPYGTKCQFAHGEKELKIVDRPPKWRSKPCQNWLKSGTCSYNDRCCFRHDGA